MRMILGGRYAVPAAILAAGALAAASVQGAKLEIDPKEGSGRAWESVRISGSGFGSATAISVEIGGVEVVPALLMTDEEGNLPPAIAVIPNALPGGQHSALVRDGQTRRFDNAYLVRPVVTLDPPIGDGRPGANWRTDRTIPEGGNMGMVFSLQGSGFPANSFVPADSLKVGGTPTLHEPIRIGPDGVLPRTTVVVTGALKSGRHELVLPGSAGAVRFSSAYHVAPWAVTDAILKRSIARMLQAVETELEGLASYTAEEIPPISIDELKGEIAMVQKEMEANNLGNAEEIAQRAQAMAAALKESGDDARREKLYAVADVITSGFDTLQPPGAPPNRSAAQTVADGRQTLEQARAAIENGEFDQARTLLKESNQLLKKGREEVGRQETEETAETIRW